MIRHTQALAHRLEANIRRTEKREWVMQRRERTRHLIELGGLVVKAGLVELTDDDRAVILGGLLTVADTLRGDGREPALVSWKRIGQRVFEADAALRGTGGKPFMNPQEIGCD